MFETELVSYLDSVSGLTALVSNRTYTPILPQQPTYPCIRYYVSEPNPEYIMTGKRSSGHEKQVQFDCYATTMAEARAIAAALESALDIDSVSGDWGSPVSIHMNAAFLENYEEFYEDDPKVARVMVQYKFSFNLL
jgi:hypothetical protein